MEMKGVREIFRIFKTDIATAVQFAQEVQNLLQRLSIRCEVCWAEPVAVRFHANEKKNFVS